jgi:hypothetical protein
MNLPPEIVLRPDIENASVATAQLEVPFAGLPDCLGEGCRDLRGIARAELTAFRGDLHQTGRFDAFEHQSWRIVEEASETVVPQRESEVAVEQCYPIADILDGELQQLALRVELPAVLVRGEALDAQLDKIDDRAGKLLETGACSASKSRG